MKSRLGSILLNAWSAMSAIAQGALSVDLLDPAETSFTIPPSYRIVDVFVDVPETDYWVAAGIRAVTRNGATVVYSGGDPNSPPPQPPIINPGLGGRFVTSLSRPRRRDENARFLNGGAAVAGAYNPAGLFTMYPTMLNVAWFLSPPGGPNEHSVDGFIARIAIDVSDVPGAPVGYDLWGIGLVAPAGATIVLSSEPPTGGAQLPGTAIVTNDDPNFLGFNWQLWFVPEPATGIAFVGLISLSRRRTRG